MSYLAHYSANNEYETFDTFEEAKKFLEERWHDDGNDDGYSEETISGGDFIAKITHFSKYKEIGNKEKDGYKWNEDEHGFYVDGDPQNDEWPVSNDFDSYGEIILEEN
jgi:viroplasmin and RNaseH domain-containing protein